MRVGRDKNFKWRLEGDLKRKRVLYRILEGGLYRFVQTPFGSDGVDYFFFLEVKMGLDGDELWRIRRGK